MSKRILIPVDGTTASETLLSLVADMARSSGATIRLLDVKPTPENIIGDYGRVVAYASQEMTRLEHLSECYLDGLAAQIHDVPVERVVRFGDEVEEILNEAEAWQAELIAVAGTERSFTGRLRRGSVADTLLRRSPTPVLIYRGR